MLVLTRKEGERIMIGDDIVLIVSKINGKQVSIGIEAPDDIAVHREEIYNKNKERELGANEDVRSEVYETGDAIGDD